MIFKDLTNKIFTKSDIAHIGSSVFENKMEICIFGYELKDQS